MQALTSPDSSAGRSAGAHDRSPKAHRQGDSPLKALAEKVLLNRKRKGTSAATPSPMIAAGRTHNAEADAATYKAATAAAARAEETTAKAAIADAAKADSTTARAATPEAAQAEGQSEGPTSGGGKSVVRLPAAPLFVARSPADLQQSKWLQRYRELNPTRSDADGHQGTLTTEHAAVLCILHLWGQ